jgi:triacylglycerol esterase/lipase EstA (alpha/beta hydrolase family)
VSVLKSFITKLAAVISVMGMGLGYQSAYGAASFSIDNIEIKSSSLNISSGTHLSLEYTGGGRQCTEIEWYFRKDGDSRWHNFSHHSTAVLEKIFRSGSHELKIAAKGFDNRWLFNLLGCDRSGQYDDRTVSLVVQTPGYTQTQYPIMLVPGVMAWDSILGVEYFYRIADMIREESDQPVKDVSLHPWQNTEERGADLANKIIDFLVIHDENFFTQESKMKVNLVAHSHGSTTSRMAINILSKEFGENAKVASLTTIAGPHYGTPVADAAVWAMNNWGTTGKLLSDYLIEMLIGDVAGAIVAIVSGHAGEYRDQEVLQVLNDFTQQGMARFNTCYPSAGLPHGVKYFFEEPLVSNDTEVKPFIDSVDLRVEDCREFNRTSNSDETFTAAQRIGLAETPNEAYGDGTTDLGTHIYGNGLGERREHGDPDAIRYFSFSGVGDWNTRFDTNILELSDTALLVLNSMFVIPGERTDESYFTTWLSDTAVDLWNRDPVARDKGYTRDSDAFIPVDSSKFGEYIGTFGPWNHIDEQNGLFGWLDATAEDPITIYRNHINRLQRAGL